MQTLDAINSRRSIRTFRSDEVSQDLLTRTLAAGMSAPSALDEQPWHFIILDGPGARGAMEEIQPQSAMAQTAPAAIVVCCDMDLVKLPDFWVQDCSAASQNILLGAHDLGLGAVWVGVFPMADRIQILRRRCNLPDSIVPFALIPLGHPGEDLPARETFQPSRVHCGAWLGKTLSVVAFSALVASTALAEDALFYLGTYTKGGTSEGIYACQLNLKSGKLTEPALVAKADDPSFLACSADGAFLYAATSAEGGSVASFRKEGPAAFTKINEQPAGGKGTCHVWVDGKNRNLLAANYSGGNIACFPIRGDGSLGEASATVPFTGSGPDPKRQQKPFAHAIYTDPESRFVYACDLGSDSIWTFSFDPSNGTLTPTDPPAAKVPPGGGPRHLALHPKGRFAYANNEMGLTVTAFRRDPATGVLTAIETVPTLPDGTPHDGVTTAEIQCHPNGKWLYVSNRGHDSITVFAIADDGRLTRVETVPCGVAVPRGFSLDPTGQWLVAAGQKDNRITVLKVDGTTGRLSPTGQYASVGSPVCVLFPPLGK